MSWQKLPTEIVERIAGNLDLSDVQSFRLSCRKNENATFDTLGEKFFSTCKSSLIGKQLARLEGIAAHEGLRKHVKRLSIQDESEYVDPYFSVCPRRESSDIWPRDEARAIDTTKIGVDSLRSMLIEGRLRPDEIYIRDYAITDGNLRYCSERVQKLLCYDRGHQLFSDCEPRVVATFAETILHGTGVAITSIDTHYDNCSGRWDLMMHGPPTYHLPDNALVSSPHVMEMTFRLAPHHHGQGLYCSALRTASLEDSQYWTKQAVHSAPHLETLKLNKTAISRGTRIVSSRLENVELRLTDLASDTILALLERSRGSLHHIAFNCITLCDGSRWVPLLNKIANEFAALESFKLKALTEENNEIGDRDCVVSFFGFRKDFVPPECRAGLELKERGIPGNMKLTHVEYRGPRADFVIKRLISYAHYRNR